MKPPKSYSEWVSCLDELREGMNDEQVLHALENGELEWTRGVAERLTAYLYQTVNSRLTKAAELLNLDLKRCNNSETAYVKALLSTRRRLAILYKVANIPALPEQVKEALQKSLMDYAQSAQQSLEDSALSDRSGRIRIMVKNNPVTKFDEIEQLFTYQPQDNKDLPVSVAKDKLSTKPARRRVILP